MPGLAPERARAAQLRGTIKRLIVRGLAIMVCTSLAVLTFDMLVARAGTTVPAGLTRAVDTVLLVSLAVSLFTIAFAGICFLVYLIRYRNLLGLQRARSRQEVDARKEAAHEPDATNGPEEQRKK